jgi:hypothetical protein
MQVDHIDCDGLNNVRSNLRAATHLENQRNCRISSRNTSGVKGVYWQKATQKWVAQIRVKGRVQRLGSFHTIDEAADAYATASKSFHGDFGRLS